jgi:4a-hydroxytetrahydrobiopterin dehydratase
MITKLSTEQVKEQLALLGSRWESIEEKFLQKSYAFDSFIASLAFVNQVGEIAEASEHHPDIHIHYDKVLLELWTHDVEGISEKDFVLAKKIDGIM